MGNNHIVEEGGAKRITVVAGLEEGIQDNRQEEDTWVSSLSMAVALKEESLKREW